MDRAWAPVPLLLGLLAACSTVPPPAAPAPAACWDDAEQLGERTRFLPGVPEDKALAAAERLLRLSARADATIARAGQGLSASVDRDRSFYLFLVAYQREVHERWTVATRPWPDGSEVCVQVRGHYFADSFAFGAEGVANVVYPASERERGRIRFAPPAQAYAVGFDTFWARLEHLAGLRPDWALCPPGGSPRRNEARGRMELDPLCHLLADQAAPKSSVGGEEPF